MTIKMLRHGSGLRVCACKCVSVSVEGYFGPVLLFSVFPCLFPPRFPSLLLLLLLLSSTPPPTPPSSHPALPSPSHKTKTLQTPQTSEKVCFCTRPGRGGALDRSQAALACRQAPQARPGLPPPRTLPIAILELPPRPAPQDRTRFPLSLLLLCFNFIEILKKM